MSDKIPTKKPRKSKIVSLLLIIFAFLLIVAIIFSFTSKSPLIPFLSFNQIFGNNVNFNNFLSFKTPLQGESEGRTNILVIGTDYDNKTDTILIISYFHQEKKISTFSLPRDLLVNDGFGEKKINAVWGQANARRSNGNVDTSGEEFLATFLSRNLNIPIHYYATITIDGVSRIIDEVGGIDIEVDNSFTDCEFPTNGYTSYLRPCPGFKKGKTTMDSKTALIYARSRKSYDNPLEALDMARNLRQMKVIEAIRNKFANLVQNGSLFFDLPRLTKLIQILGDNLKTSLNPQEILTLTDIAKDKEVSSKIIKYTLDYEKDIICEDPNATSLYLCDGGVFGQNTQSLSMSKLQNDLKNILNNNSQVKDLLKTKSVAIVSNGSKNFESLRLNLLNSGVRGNGILTDNMFTKIKAPTTQDEQITLYIPDSETYNTIKTIESQLNTNLTSKINLVNKKQEKYIFTPQYTNVDITAIIE
jgi:LCP family protein required for cell wall assembly